jgi:hypothetical protein
MMMLGLPGEDEHVWTLHSCLGSAVADDQSTLLSALCTLNKQSKSPVFFNSNASPVPPLCLWYYCCLRCCTCITWWKALLIIEAQRDETFLLAKLAMPISPSLSGLMSGMSSSGGIMLRSGGCIPHPPSGVALKDQLRVAATLRCDFLDRAIESHTIGILTRWIKTLLTNEQLTVAVASLIHSTTEARTVFWSNQFDHLALVLPY